MQPISTIYASIRNVDAQSPVNREISSNNIIQKSLWLIVWEQVSFWTTVVLLLAEQKVNTNRVSTDFETAVVHQTVTLAAPLAVPC